MEYLSESSHYVRTETHKAWVNVSIVEQLSPQKVTDCSSSVLWSSQQETSQAYQLSIIPHYYIYLASIKCAAASCFVFLDFEWMKQLL